ncbi:MAG: hypothetical protein QM747_15165 [Nocardioides sp.]
MTEPAGDPEHVDHEKALDQIDMVDEQEPSTLPSSEQLDPVAKA